MNDFDCIVIGSGAGGLTGAVSLAQAGRSVLVLEQHYVPGGWTHSFTLGGYRFSPGVHYLGELGPAGRLRGIYEGLGVSGDLEFCELNPEAINHVRIAGAEFDLPRGRDRVEAALAERFPAERRGIGRYLNLMEKIVAELKHVESARSLADRLRLPLRAPTFLRWGLRPLSSLLRHAVDDPVLATVLAAEGGDYAVPPSRTPSVLHASIVTHYFDGAWYPRGGGFVIPRAFVRALKRAGGSIRLRSRVERILVESDAAGGRRAVGVRLDDGTELRAGQVLSNADPGVTFGQLLEPDQLSGKLRGRLERTRYSVSVLSLFLATDLDLRAHGLDSGNYWYYPQADADASYDPARVRRWIDGEGTPTLFVTAPSLKDPTKRSRQGHHTLEAFTFVPFELFSAWSGSRLGSRPEGYEELKRKLTDRMLEGVYHLIPELRGRIVFQELGTPLTNAYYVEATEGNIYGTEKTRDQIGPGAFSVRSEIDGLFLCGASTLAHGILGATASGLVAAGKMLDCRMQDLLCQRGPELVTFAADDPSTWPESVRARVAERTPA